MSAMWKGPSFQLTLHTCVIHVEFAGPCGAEGGLAQFYFITLSSQAMGLERGSDGLPEHESVATAVPLGAPEPKSHL